MFNIFINDEEVVCESNYELKEEFMNPSSIELYKVYPKKWKGTNKLLEEYYFPEDYSKCKFLKDGELYFAGIVKNSADMELNPFKPHYCSLQILDFSTLLSEGTTLDFVITNKTVKEAINQIISSISDYGFVSGNIDIPNNKNTIIGAYSTLDKAPFDVFQYLSQISGTRWGTRMIDEFTTAIDFFDPEVLNNLGTIDVNKTYCINNKIEDISYDFSTNDYRNKQIITSEQVYANISIANQIVSNGYDQIFLVEQKIGKINSIVSNNIELTFATKTEKKIGVVADFYYEVGSNEIETDNIYSIGTAIKIEYIPLIKGREISYNISEIQRVNNNLGRNGTISRYENRTDVTDSSELQAVSDSYIKIKGNAEIIVNIKSRNDFLVLGGKYKFNSPISKLNSDYLVKSKTTKTIKNGDFMYCVYKYELSNNYDTENEINYFDNQRSKVNGNIADGEYISRNIDINSEINIVFSNLIIEEVEFNSNNTLESRLSSPFVK